MSFHVPEDYRLTTGGFATSKADGNNGAFFIPLRDGPPLKVIASDGMMGAELMPELGGWEHVSVSLPDRCPTWREMCRVKSLFWDETDCVVQFHPPESEYVNNHPYCLHLWRKIDGAFPMPPSIPVGYKGLGILR